MRLKAREIVDLCVELMKSRKAQDILIINVQGVTDTADYFVLCTGMSSTQVRAICEAVTEGLEEKEESAWHVEGLEERQWVLIDFVDVVIHVFQPEVREFYSLERLWGDGICEEVEYTPDKPVTETGFDDVKARS